MAYHGSFSIQKLDQILSSKVLNILMKTDWLHLLLFLLIKPHTLHDLCR